MLTDITNIAVSPNFSHPIYFLQKLSDPFASSPLFFRQCKPYIHKIDTSFFEHAYIHTSGYKNCIPMVYSFSFQN